MHMMGVSVYACDACECVWLIKHMDVSVCWCVNTSTPNQIEFHVSHQTATKPIPFLTQNKAARNAGRKPLFPTQFRMLGPGGGGCKGGEITGLIVRSGVGSWRTRNQSRFGKLAAVLDWSNSMPRDSSPRGMQTKCQRDRRAPDDNKQIKRIKRALIRLVFLFLGGEEKNQPINCVWTRDSRAPIYFIKYTNFGATTRRETARRNVYFIVENGSASGKGKTTTKLNVMKIRRMQPRRGETYVT